MIVLYLFCSIAAVLCLDGDVKEITNNTEIISPEYHTSENLLQIDCSSPTVMNNASFPGWIKIWRVNDAEDFDVTFITFINRNATIQFNELSINDSGKYECCYHAYAYEDFICSVTVLTVDNTAPAVTSPATPPNDSWNVNITDLDVIYAQANNSYFIKMFYENVTNIKCAHGQDEEAVNLRTSNNFPDPINCDLLIVNFNPLLDSGDYTCTGSIQSGNETLAIQANFTIVESEDTNLHANQLEPQLISQYLSQASSSATFLTVLFIIYFIRQ